MWDYDHLKPMKPLCDCPEKRYGYTSPIFHAEGCAYRIAATEYLTKEEEEVAA